MGACGLSVYSDTSKLGETQVVSATGEMQIVGPESPSNLQQIGVCSLNVRATTGRK